MIYLNKFRTLSLSVFLLILVFNFINVSNSFAKEKAFECDNRYVALVNPVRGRDLWIDKTITPLINQYDLARKYNVPVTWLLQYDVLKDKELISEIRKFNNSQEKGVFLEVSQSFAEESRVIYPHDKPWFNPSAVFLSGYSQTDRRKLIDNLFNGFKDKLGFFPKSVGAWWIDSYSLGYMKERYGITSALIVADQKTTDNYGVWGQWWGVPYYPSKANILTPANNLNNKEDVVIIQWAQRDPILAYGEGPSVSNYSLQANDYIRQKKDTTYFADLVNVYLDCKNPIGQVTVGLETGIESIGYINEYENQLKYLSHVKNLKAVNMSQFADNFSRIFPKFPNEFLLNYQDSSWILKINSRDNLKLKDHINYHNDISFNDFFIPDNEIFLNRNLEILNKNEDVYFPYFLAVIFLLGLTFLYKRLFSIWIIGTLFAVSSFGLILRSNYQYGWQVFYGSKLPLLMFVQIFLVLTSYFLIWLLHKKIKKKFILFFIPLSFGLDFIIQSLRFSYFGGKYYLGIGLDSLRFVGFSFQKLFNFEIINKDFPSFLSAALLRFNFNKIWDNLFISLFIYPLVHILIGTALGYLLIRLPDRFRKIVIAIFITFAALQLFSIFQADPRLVQ